MRVQGPTVKQRILLSPTDWRSLCLLMFLMGTIGHPALAAHPTLTDADITNALLERRLAREKAYQQGALVVRNYVRVREWPAFEP